jgi:hypothetical protein
VTKKKLSIIPAQDVATLAAALKADILCQSTSTPSSSVECFLCGRSYTYKALSGDDSGRFCSDKCREAYDAGYRRPEPIDPFKITKWRLPEALIGLKKPPQAAR